MFEIKFDLKQFVLTQLMSLNKNKDNIEKNQDRLYKIVQNYLEVLNVNPKFLDKPSIIERVKYIIFNNILRSEEVQFKSNGIFGTDKDKKYTKILSVLQNGSILFYYEQDGKKMVVSFDEINDELACRFLEYTQNDVLKSEKRVILDDYGFDKKFVEINGILSIDEINEKFREKFKHIITHINGVEIIAFTDWGNHSITPLLDNKFLCVQGAKKINPEELYEENKIQSIKVKDRGQIIAAYPFDIPEMDDESILKIQTAYNYYKDKYPLAKTWFINRFGKQFLIDKNIISSEEEFEEESLLGKLSTASEDEVLINFQNSVEFQENEILEIIENMYSKEMYGKAMVFFDKLTDKQKIQFLNNSDEYSIDFVSVCIARIKNDSEKIEQYENFSDQLSVNNKVAIISSINDEDEKVDLYKEIIGDIIAYDTEQGESIETGEDAYYTEIVYLSGAVLDSLKDKENIKEFILKFSDFSIIKYENLKDMTKEDIDYLLEEIGEGLDTEENVAFLKTDYVDDEYILELLEKNWKEGLQLSSDDPIELGEDLSYSFKVFALLKLKDEEARKEFLDKNIKDFSAEEISIILEDMDNSFEMLSLAKKYNLPPDYFYYLVTLCEDEFKFMCLENQTNIEIENFIRVASSIQDIPKAFDYVTKTDKIDIISKLATINEFNIVFCDDITEFAEKKYQFLIENKEEIAKAIKTEEDSETFNLYISEFWEDEEKMLKIEKQFSEFMEQDIK